MTTSSETTIELQRLIIGHDWARRLDQASHELCLDARSPIALSETASLGFMCFFSVFVLVVVALAVRARASHSLRRTVAHISS